MSNCNIPSSQPVEDLDSLPPASNPYFYDKSVHGTLLGINLVILCVNYVNQECQWFIVYDRKTGKRKKINVAAFFATHSGTPD